MSDTTGFGYMWPPNNGSDFNRTIFQSKQLVAKLRTLVPVRVIKVYKQDGTSTATRGEVAGAGFVDVQPVVSQVDGKGQKEDHGTIFHVPYTRMYGGDGALIMDPVKGDIGYIKPADRDISAFKDQIRQGSSTNVNPGSRRRHDLADSLYMGGVLNNSPAQYITFQDNQIIIHAKNGNQVVLDKSGNVQVIPGGGGLVFLGGTGSDGNYDFVSTPSGPSTNVKAKIS